MNRKQAVSWIDYLFIQIPSFHYNCNCVAGWGPAIFSLSPQILFFGDLKPHAIFQDPMITPSVRKVTQAEKKRRNAVNSGHLVL